MKTFHFNEPPSEEVVALSKRELETIKLVAEGHSNRLIAIKLGVSPHTSKFHVQNLLRKLKVDNRAQAAVYAVRMGWA
jgi:two-component system nitrate/nitrite response regulator NarL